MHLEYLSSSKSWEHLPIEYKILYGHLFPIIFSHYILRVKIKFKYSLMFIYDLFLLVKKYLIQIQILRNRISLLL